MAFVLVGWLVSEVWGPTHPLQHRRSATTTSSGGGGERASSSVLAEVLTLVVPPTRSLQRKWTSATGRLTVTNIGHEGQLKGGDTARVENVYADTLLSYT